MPAEKYEAGPFDGLNSIAYESLVDSCSNEVIINLERMGIDYDDYHKVVGIINKHINAAFDELAGAKLIKQREEPQVEVVRSTKTGDEHTRHCCKTCGCKYGEDQPIESTDDVESFIPCTVVSGAAKQEHECTGDCFGLG